MNDYDIMGSFIILYGMNIRLLEWVVDECRVNLVVFFILYFFIKLVVGFLMSGYKSVVGNGV